MSGGVLNIAQGSRPGRKAKLETGKQLPLTAKGVPQRPKGMSKVAIEFWDRHVPVLIEAGLATAADEAELLAMTDFWCIYRKFSTYMHTLQPSDKNFRVAVYGLNTSYERFRFLSAQFGMTPMDRQIIRRDKLKGVMSAEVPNPESVGVMSRAR